MGRAICPKLYLTSLPFNIEVIKEVDKGPEKGRSVIIESEAIPEGNNLRICADLYSGIVTAFLVSGEKGNVASFPTGIQKDDGIIVSRGVPWEKLEEPKKINYTEAPAQPGN